MGREGGSRKLEQNTKAKGRRKEKEQKKEKKEKKVKRLVISYQSSQSIIPHSHEYGLRSTDENPQIGDEVEIFIRHTGKGRIRRSVKKPGYVVEIDSRDPTRVKTHNCLHKFHKVIENCTRHSTSMISN